MALRVLRGDLGQKPMTKTICKEHVRTGLLFLMLPAKLTPSKQLIEELGTQCF